MTEDREIRAIVEAATQVLHVFNTRLKPETPLPISLCRAIEELDNVIRVYRSRRHQPPLKKPPDFAE